MTTPRLMAAVLVASGWVALGIAVASDPGRRCATAKLRAAGQKSRGKLECHARGVKHGGGVDSACLARVEAKFAAAWDRSEAAGGCVTTGDADTIEGKVDVFVNDVASELPATTTTTSTTTSTVTIGSTSSTTSTATVCPPTSTTPPCGPEPGHMCAGFALCPPGQNCVTIGTSCACSGPPVPCGDLPMSFSGRICELGDCPTGTSCRSHFDPTTCFSTCGCD